VPYFERPEGTYPANPRSDTMTNTLFPFPTPAETAEAASRIVKEHGGPFAAEQVLRRTFDLDGETPTPDTPLQRRLGAVRTAIASKLPAPPRKCEGCGHHTYVRWYTLRHLDMDTAVPTPDLEPLTVHWCSDCVDSAQEGFGEYYGICYRAEVRVDFLEPENQRRMLRMHSPNAIIPADWSEA